MCLSGVNFPFPRGMNRGIGSALEAWQPIVHNLELEARRTKNRSWNSLIITNKIRSPATMAALKRGKPRGYIDTFMLEYRWSRLDERRCKGIKERRTAPMAGHHRRCDVNTPVMAVLWMNVIFPSLYLLICPVNKMQQVHNHNIQALLTLSDCLLFALRPVHLACPLALTADSWCSPLHCIRRSLPYPCTV